MPIRALKNITFDEKLFSTNLLRISIPYSVAHAVENPFYAYPTDKIFVLGE